jgi:hypothetical protein
VQADGDRYFTDVRSATQFTSAWKKDAAGTVKWGHHKLLNNVVSHAAII